MSGPVTIGQVVHYRLSADDVANINVQRARLLGSVRGNAVREGDVYPAVVVATFAGYKSISAPLVCNLQVHLDGPDTYWATSRAETTQDTPESGGWFWPPRVGG